MGRAQIKLDANDRIAIGGQPYRVAEHPALPGIPYIQRGGRGFVIQLVRPDGERLALKYFKLKYRVAELVTVAAALDQYADIPGLRAAHRIVFTQAAHAALLEAYPALEYGMLMPWLPGVTWYDLVTTKAPISPRESVRLAQTASAIMAGLEARAVAHCDIAGGNVMVERRTARVELVDIEEMYGAALPHPVDAPAGQDGYQHRSSRDNGQWRPEGDRFGAAVLLAEMLGWSDGRIRANSADEHYFAASEIQDPASGRYQLMHDVLAGSFGAPVGDLFEAAWRSPTLADCPPLAIWRDTLGAIPVDEQPESLAAVSRQSSPVVSGRRMVGQSDVATSETAEHAQESATARLEGKRLCRNCGEANEARESFCKRCGFYIGVGARKPMSAGLAPTPAPGAPGPTVQPPALPQKPAPPPQAIPLNRKLDDVITARRLPGPQGNLERVDVRLPAEPPVEANLGAWVVVGAIALIVLVVLILAISG